MTDSPETATVCPRCGDVATSTIAIAGMSFSGCATCQLPVKYYNAYKKEYETTVDCPFCEGLGELNYTLRKDDPNRWGPCLYCRSEEFQDWVKRSD